MKKSILISIRPQHVVNILNGDKTIELRKVLPKWVKEEVAKGNSVEAYIYCTKKPGVLSDMFDYCQDEHATYAYFTDFLNNRPNPLNGLVPCKFTVRKISGYFYPHEIKTHEKLQYILKDSCVSQTELEEYCKDKENIGDKAFYALHIEDLVIFNEPMELSDFVSNKPIENVCGNEEKCFTPTASYFYEKGQVLTKSPQSMQTVWVEENK